VIAPVERGWPVQPGSRAQSNDRRAGFTLIEVVAVMLIIALVASLAVTVIPGTGRGKLKALTLETAALLRRERLGAVLTGKERQVSLDGERRVLVGHRYPRHRRSVGRTSGRCSLYPGWRIDRRGAEIITRERRI
jgi:prepilin-type N-terminal cleavage/methylation domain-containing protein